jgi:hypothetical protein
MKFFFMTNKKLLILGDGNFSFSLALAKLLDQKHAAATNYIQGYNADIICTSFDSYKEVVSKYHDSERILEELVRYCQVAHEVNAWELQDYKNMDFIIWNHPHLGTEDFRLHQFLMAHFFHSAKRALSSTGKIRVSLVQGQETRWNVFVQANRVGMNLEKVEIFDESLWPGYVVKRNKHGGSFKNIHTKKHVRTSMKSCVYTFGTDKEFIDIKDIPFRLESLFGKNFDTTFEEKTFVAVKSELTPSQKLSKSKKPLPPKDLICTFCSKQLTSVRAYQQHVHMVHILQKFGDWKPDRPRTISCIHCGKKFADNESAEQHTINKHTFIQKDEIPNVEDNAVQNDHQYEYYPCEVCGQSCINQPWGMELHLERMKPALGMNMRCPLCPLSFIEQRALTQHFKFCKFKNCNNSCSK